MRRIGIAVLLLAAPVATPAAAQETGLAIGTPAPAVTVNDLYAFDANAVVSIDPFCDIIGRHFKQPKEGLGNDNTPASHMWRTLANPDAPL